MRLLASFGALVAWVGWVSSSRAAGGVPGRSTAAPPTTVQASKATLAQELTPSIADAMLSPVARARVEVATWQDALGYVRARSTDLRIALGDVVRAEAQQRVALAGVLPSLSGVGSYTRNLRVNSLNQFVGVDPLGNPISTSFDSPPTDYLSGSLVASLPVIAPRAWNAIGTTKLAKEAASFSYGDAQRLIVLNVANAIVAVVTSERLSELNRVGLLNALQRLDIAERRTNLGGGTGLDVLRAKQDVASARAALVAGDETLRQSRESFGLALGIPEQVGVPPEVDIDGLEQSARSVCTPATLETRSDISALRKRVDVAHRSVTDVKAQFSPLVSLQSALGATTLFQAGGPNPTWNVQAILSIPFWEGGARYGNLRDVQAQERQSLERLEAQRRNAQVEVTRAQRAVIVAEERKSVAETARDIALETDRLTRTAYQEGLGTSLELVTAAQALREAAIQLTLREFELVRARVASVLALASCTW